MSNQQSTLDALLASLRKAMEPERSARAKLDHVKATLPVWADERDEAGEAWGCAMQRSRMLFYDHADAIIAALEATNGKR